MLLHICMNTRFLSTALLVLLSCVIRADAKPSKKQRILQACVREFGPAVDLNQNLFEINESFVLQAKFDERGLLLKLAVKPKHYFNESHSEWEEPPSFPLIAWNDFRKLLARLDSVKPKGKLTKMANKFSGRYK